MRINNRSNCDSFAKFNIVLYTIFLSFFALFFVPVSSANGQVRLVVEQSPPYVESSREDGGIMTQLIVDAFAKVSISAEVEYANWNVVEKRLDNERVLSFMWTKSKPLLKKWLYSEPIYRQQRMFAVLKPFRPDVNLIHNLRGYKLGLTQGFSYGKTLESMRAKLSISQFSSDYLALRDLIDGKVQLVAIDPPVALDLANKFFGKKDAKRLSFVEAPYFESTEYYLVCAKRYGNCLNHIKKFNQGLAMLGEDGASKSLLSKLE